MGEEHPQTGLVRDLLRAVNSKQDDRANEIVAQLVGGFLNDISRIANALETLASPPAGQA